MGDPYTRNKHHGPITLFALTRGCCCTLWSLEIEGRGLEIREDLGGVFPGDRLEHVCSSSKFQLEKITKLRMNCKAASQDTCARGYREKSIRGRNIES